MPPVAPPPRKVSNGSVPEMSVFRGLGGGSSPPQGSFGPLPKVTPPPAPPGAPPAAPRSLPPVSPPSPRIVPPAPRSRDPLAESITHVRAGAAPDTFRDAPHSLDEATNPAIASRPSRRSDDSLDWDEEEESTHVFHSSAPPPFGQAGPAGPLPSSHLPPVSHPPMYRPSTPGHENGHVQTARGIAPPPALSGAAMAGPPSTDTLKLDALSAAPPSSSSSSVPPPRNGQSGLSQGMFPPPPPVPSITQARPMGSSVPGIVPGAIQEASPLPNDDVVRDQPFVRLPSGNPYTATELAIRKPTLPASYVPPTSLPTSALPERGSSSVGPLPGSASPLAHSAIVAPEVRGSKSWILAAAAVAAVLSIGALVTFLFTRRPGGVQVEVKDASGATVPKAEVYVDGRKVCDATPCSVRDLEVGRHSVRVMTPTEEGLEPVSIDVEAGNTTPVTFTLKPQLATFVATTDQPGVRLFVDDVDRGPLPTKLTDLAPGKHQLALKGERYKTVERIIELKPGETHDFEVPRLAITKGHATVVLKTEGASVTIVRTDEKAPARYVDGPYPRTIEVDTTGKWQLVAKKKGLPDFVANLDFPDGVPERTIEVELREEKSPESIASSTPSPTPTPSGPVSTPTRTAATEPKRSDPAPEPTPAPASGMGTLNINSIPASRVLLDGAPLGETPKTGVSVTAGTHTVTFIHPELGKKSVSVKVGPGETKTASAKLRAD